MNKIVEALLNSLRHEQWLGSQLANDEAFESFSAFLTVGPQLEGC